MTSEEYYQKAFMLTGEQDTPFFKGIDAADAFAAIGNYEDAPRLAMYCYAVAAGESGAYSLAVANLQTLGAFRDAALLATYYTARAYEADEQYESAQKLLDDMAFYRDAASRLKSYPEKILARDYASADSVEQSGTTPSIATLTFIVPLIAAPPNVCSGMRNDSVPERRAPSLAM